VKKQQELVKTERINHRKEPEQKKSIHEIIVNTNYTPDFDWRKRQLRDRLDTAPRTVTHKVTKIWGDEWDQKSEKWAAEMPEKFLEHPGRWVEPPKKDEDQK